MACVSKHKGHNTGRPHPSRRAHASTVLSHERRERALLDEGGIGSSACWPCGIHGSCLMPGRKGRRYLLGTRPSADILTSITGSGSAQAPVAERPVALPPDHWRGAMTDIEKY